MKIRPIREVADELARMLMHSPDFVGIGIASLVDLQRRVLFNQMTPKEAEQIFHDGAGCDLVLYVKQASPEFDAFRKEYAGYKVKMVVTGKVA